ncbi:reverse transcriptase domain-containing protein, partial [Tanacetum coccineum]
NQSESRKSKGCSKHALAKQPKTNAATKRQTFRLKQIPLQSSGKGPAMPRHTQKCTNKKDFHWTTEAEEAFQTMKKLIAELPTLMAPKKEKELVVYLSAANEAVSVVLLVERDGRKSPIHYVSRTLQRAEVNYPPMEKLVLALVHAARRLRRYFQGHTIKLEAYGIKYAPKKRDKKASARRLLAGAMAEDSSTQEKTSRPNDTLAEGERREEQKAPKTITPKNLKVETDIWKLYSNGASNKHRSRAGLILIDLEGTEYSYALRLNFANSNNDAEYEALLAGLRIATKIKVEKMHALVDSKLVANQVEGSYEAKGEKTKKYKEKALEMIRSFNNFQISHIPREENRKADALSKLAAVQCEGLTKGVLIEELNVRSVDMAEVNAIIEEETTTWMTPIQEYIEHVILPEDVTEARTIREKARNYTIEEGVLYR